MGAGDGVAAAAATLRLYTHNFGKDKKSSDAAASAVGTQWEEI